MAKAQPGEFEVLSADEMQKKYGLYAETRPKISLDSNNVPEQLRDLIPLAEQFGVGCDIRRHDLGSKTKNREKQKLSEALKGRHKDIARWLNEWDGKSTPTKESSAFLRLCIFEMEECEGPGLPGKNTDINEWYEQYLIRRYGTID